MKVALGQFAVDKLVEKNLATCCDLMLKAHNQGADLLVLPEGVLAQDIADPDLPRKVAQPLEGPFVTQLLAASMGRGLTTVMCVHVPAHTSGRIWNVQIAIRDGVILRQYRKIHLYDAFTGKESANVDPGLTIPALFEVAGMKVGMLTCYDVRFPELARHLALDGAEVIVVPAAWVKGPHKEKHWEVMVTARALENTCYVVAVGDCGERNIGNSLVVDPLGVVVAGAAESPALVFAELDPARLVHARAVLPVLKNRRFDKPVLSTHT